MTKIIAATFLVLTAGALAQQATLTGTLSIGPVGQNTVFAGPSSGGSGAASYRSLSLADLPALAANSVMGATTAGTPTALSMPSCSGASNALIWTTGSGFGCNSITATSAANLTGGAVGSAVYQSGSGATSFIASPTISGHTFFYGWQPSGSAIAPTAIDLGTYLASPPAIGGTIANAGKFTTINASSAVSVGSSPPTACGSATGCIALSDASTAGTPTSGQAYIRADSSSGHLLYSINGSAEANLVGSGSMVYPGSGIAVSTGSAWSTSLTAPASAIVGISDTQTLTNKSIAASEINSGTLAVVNGGTGTSSPGLIAGTNVSVSGTWPNQTITSSAGSGPLTISGTGMTAGHVYYASSSGLAAAEATASTSVPAICYATSSTVCQINGTVTTTGLTAGGVYYVSDSTAGALTATAPTTSGHYVQRFGVALSSTVLLIDPSIDVGGIQ